MPDRYVPLRRPRGFANLESENGWKACTASDPIEEEDKPTDTGLLDQHETKIYRVRDRGPVGFDLTGASDG